MTLDNLLGMSLERIEPDPLTIQRLLKAAKRNIEDAQVKVVSTKTALTPPTRQLCKWLMPLCRPVATEP